MKKLLAVASVAAALLTAGTAVAGQKIDATVFVTTSSRFAQGSLGSARNSGDGVQYITCGLYNTGAAWCTARNAAGETGACSSTDPAIWNIVAHLRSDGLISFFWDASGKCTAVQVWNASYLAPKR